MRFKLGVLISLLVCLIPIGLFKTFGQKQLTFLDLAMDPVATTAKYQDAWNNTDIQTAQEPNWNYKMGDTIGTITIPQLNIYELPIYYGSDFINNNWQITAPGRFGNWGIPGEARPTCIGSHNYQLFHDLPSLVVGDRFIIENDVDVYVYEVTALDIYNHLVDDWDDKVFNSKEPYTVELMTCYPISEIETHDMYIVTAQMISGTKFE